LRSLKDFLSADDDRPIRNIEVEAWNVSIPTRIMTVREQDEIHAMFTKSDDEPPLIDQHRALLSRCLCDDDGKRLSAEIVDKLLNKSNVGLKQLIDKLNDENGLTPEAKEANLEKK
jgi:hypothetical protein